MSAPITFLLNALMPISLYLMPPMWVVTVIYAVWYFASAKHCAPLTIQEVKVLWKIHKQNASCNAGRWQKIKRGRKIIGFKCGCGKKHVQKRPII